jgi:hypothetical protein
MYGRSGRKVPRIVYYGTWQRLAINLTVRNVHNGERATDTIWTPESLWTPENLIPTTIETSEFTVARHASDWVNLTRNADLVINHHGTIFTIYRSQNMIYVLVNTVLY